MALERATTTAADRACMAGDFAMAKDGFLGTQTDARHFRRFVRLPGVVFFLLLFAHLALVRIFSLLAMRSAGAASATAAAPARSLQNIEESVPRRRRNERGKVFFAQTRGGSHQLRVVSSARAAGAIAVLRRLNPQRVGAQMRDRKSVV